MQPTIKGGGEVSEIKSNGLFIVLEGTDGSGKGTQFALLADKLKKEGYNVETFDFPRYDEPSSHFVKQYLNGIYGGLNDVGPYTASLFYALDRFEAGYAIKKALASGKIVLANRFTGANMGHQGTKFDNTEERHGYFVWLDNIEFEMLKIPRPDKNFVLRVPADIAQILVDHKDKRSYTDKKRDIHEADITHLEKSVEVYDNLCELFPNDFQRIDCVRNGKLLPIATIHKLLWETVQPLLPPKPSHLDTPEFNIETHNITPSNESYLAKDTSGVYSITPLGKAFLDDAITNSTGDVYGFTEKLSSVTIAAAMARLSRRGDDMRVTLLDEFATSADKDQKLIQKVITAYGDDSVQQLVGQHMVVENASNLLTKKLEWGRLGAYLEQSTRYIYYDQKDKKGNYRFYVPPQFDNNTKNIYSLAMNKIFDLYSVMVRTLTTYVRKNSSIPASERDIAWQGATRAQACDAIRTVLPVATKSTVGIFASGQALESLIMHLLADELKEARLTGQKLLDEGRKIFPAFLERADKAERGGAIIAYKAKTFSSVKELAKKYLPQNYGQQDQPVMLTNVYPNNEFDLIPNMVYEHSNLSLKEIKQEVEKWSYDKKEAVFMAYIGERLNRRHKPGRALENVYYSWDIVCDYGIFRDLQRHRMVDDLAWQPLTPRYGYEIPSLIEQADLVEQFEQCFDISMELYSQLQSAGYELEAQYATLLGHKMRWKVSYNVREAFHLHELRTSPQGHPGYRKLVGQMHELLAQHHPLLAEAMKFVNKDEDPELTRLAAERATQYKLKLLSN